MQYPLLSDYPDGKTVVAYGVDYREGEARQMFARPSFFLVDKKGVVRGYWGQRPPNPDDELFAPDPVMSSTPMLAMAAKIATEN